MKLSYPSVHRTPVECADDYYDDCYAVRGASLFQLRRTASRSCGGHGSGKDSLRHPASSVVGRGPSA